MRYEAWELFSGETKGKKFFDVLLFPSTRKASSLRKRSLKTTTEFPCENEILKREEKLQRNFHMNTLRKILLFTIYEIYVAGMSLCLSKDVKVNDENKTFEDRKRENAQDSFIFRFQGNFQCSIFSAARGSPGKDVRKKKFISNASTTFSWCFNNIFFRLFQVQSSTDDQKILKIWSKLCERKTKFRRIFNFFLFNVRIFQHSQHALIPVQQFCAWLYDWELSITSDVHQSKAFSFVDMDMDESTIETKSNKVLRALIYASNYLLMHLFSNFLVFTLESQ